jgi:ATP-binding cassette subfamily B protein/subfamily B ATP-binding cassette protein MsbA
MVSADRVFPLIDQVPKIRNPANPQELPAGPLAVEFDNVSFSYDPGREVVTRVSFSVPAGTSLGIIGPNGCGKSSLINLVPRFFDVDSGAVRVGGIDVRDTNIKSMRKRVGYVTQQTMLFNDTIAENIKYGSPGASQTEVVAAARAAHADGFIDELEEGYESSIGEHGGKLSGGQRQRLTLARAILKNPDVLLLDEATSQIDPHSEKLIQETLTRFIRNRTTIVVTHRMETLALVDRILVMDGGEIVDIGTHEELLRRCETYRRVRQSSMQEAA